MSNGLPKKVLAAIETDVKKAFKVAKQPWQGFGPIAEAHMSPDQTHAVVVWRQASKIDGAPRTNMMVGNYLRQGDAWVLRNTVGADYKHDMPTRNVDELVKKEKKHWTKNEAIAA